MDRYTKEQRSKNMSAIRSSGNKTTELRFIKILKIHKTTGWRRNFKNVYGKPDFVFPKQKTAVFIDGCFWHGCKLHRNLPATNKKFWKDKIMKNKSRDKKVNYQLKKIGWKVLRFWEHAIKNKRVENIEKVIAALK